MECATSTHNTHKYIVPVVIVINIFFLTLSFFSLSTWKTTQKITIKIILLQSSLSSIFRFITEASWNKNGWNLPPLAGRLIAHTGKLIGQLLQNAQHVIGQWNSLQLGQYTREQSVKLCCFKPDTWIWSKQATVKNLSESKVQF